MNYKQNEIDVSRNLDGEYGTGWRGTFEMWQNPAFGELYEKHCRQKRFRIGDIQAFISSRPIIGNLSLKVYCLPREQPLDEIMVAAKQVKAARLWIYSVNEVAALRDNLEETAHTYILDLRCANDVLWKNMGSKTRNMVRKGEKKGVVIRKAESEREFNQWWKTYVGTARTKDFDTQNYDLVLATFKNASLSQLFVSLVDEQIVGGFFFLVNNYPMYWLGAFDRNFLGWSPSNLCIWNSILCFKEQGFQLLDLGGAVTQKEHGPTQFKKSLGGKLAAAYIYNVPVSGLKSRLLNIIMRFYGQA